MTGRRSVPGAYLIGVAILTGSVLAGCGSSPSMSVDLTGPLTTELVVAIALGTVIVVLAVTVAMVTVLHTLHRTDRELDVGIKPLRFGTTRRAPLAVAADELATMALQRLADLEQALVGLVEATDAQLEGRGNYWFDLVCETLGAVLAVDRNFRFRVAIWTDDEQDDDFVRGLAYFNLDRFDRKYEKLSRATTLAGWVVAHRRDHYAPDVLKCDLYTKRASAPTYRSLYAIPLGAADNPWAAMTVDAQPVDGLDGPPRAIIVRFGVLATVGARIISIRSSRQGGTTG